MYKIETHCHTPIMSPCGRVPVQELVRRYQEAGYAAITITDHFFPASLGHFGVDLDADNVVQTYLEGYRQAKQEADKVGLTVYYGAEIRFAENQNDYLLYGFRPELLAAPEKMHRMGLAAFSELAREAGALLIQAHPFRTGCVPVAPYLVDGIEAVNRHDVHKNRNELSLALAERYGLLKTGGTDFHDPQDRCIGGIEADWLPKDSMELAKLIRSGDFRLLGWDQDLRGK